MKITIVGCGNMGLVYARAFLKYNIVSSNHLLLVEKNENRSQELTKLNIGKVVLPNDRAIGESDVVILAVKPQDFKDLAGHLKSVLGKEQIILSIMAGVKIAGIQQWLEHGKVVRAMPNSPVEIGMGVTAYSASAEVNVANLHKAESLLATTGRSVYMEDENLLDAVTALSGSGPAYYFYFVRAMMQAGEKMGLDASVSTMLVKQTMLGAFHLINNANKSLDDLIATVASKGGTTEAALGTFESNHVHESIVEALENACKRAKELSQ